MKSNHLIITETLSCWKTFYQITKNEKYTIKNESYKNWKTTWNNILFWVQGYTKNFEPEKVKMTNKVLREKSHSVVCRSNKSRFLKQYFN